MNLFELLSLIAENLSRRKARVALTAIGVVIGTAAVVVLVSLGVGLQRNATSQLGSIQELTQIQVMPSYGEEMMKGGGGVVMSVRGGSGPSTTQLITDQTLRDLAALPGVTAVVPRDYVMGEAMVAFNRLEGYSNFIGMGVADLTTLGLTAQAGSLKLAKGTAVVGAMVPNNFYDPRARPGQETPAPPDLMDKQLRITLTKWSSDNEPIRKVITVHVTGVIAETRGEADYSIYLPLEDVTLFNDWFMGRRINRTRDGYNMAIVQVAELDHVLDVADQISALGYQTYTPQSFVQGINSFYIILQIVFGGVGAIALLVAAIGIANTMTMAILERTREIGLMKALGATNRDVLSIFLGEAAGIGFVGGLGGVAIGWSGGQILNVFAVAYLAGQASQQGGLPPTAAVYTPIWLPIFTLGFATFIGLVSGLYPALRAATLVPVNALKYE